MRGKWGGLLYDRKDIQTIIRVACLAIEMFASFLKEGSGITFAIFVNYIKNIDVQLRITVVSYCNHKS